MTSTRTRTRPSSDEDAAGRIGRRKRLPSGRAVAGGFAVAVAVVAVFAAFVASRGTSGRAWVVASTGLPAGTRLTSSDLATTTLRLGSGPVAAEAFEAPGDLIGRTLAIGVGRGGLIVQSELSAPDATPALRPVPVSVTPGDLVDLARGDLVDVLVTAGNGSNVKTTVVIRGARVLATNQPAGGLVGTSGDNIVTLGVHTLAEVEAVIGSEHGGTVDLVVGEPSDGSGQGA